MDKPLHVLQIEDSEDDAALIARTLRRGRYDPLVTRVDTEGALNAALHKPWDLVLADWSLPQFSALAALEMLKRQGLDLPFIIVSGKISEEAAVAAMKAGAHDYVMKDNLSRLVPAIERELREAQARREHRQAEAERRVLEERLTVVVRETNDAIWDWNLTTNVVWWNNAFRTLFGASAHEIESGIESWDSRLHPEERERVIAGRFAAINGGGVSWSDEYRFRRADGSYAHVLDRGSILRNEQGRAVRMIGAMIDITARRLAEEALLESESRFQAFMGNSPAIAFMKDEEGRYVYTNPRWEAVFHRLRGEWQGKTDFELWPPEVARQLREHDLAVLFSEKPVELEEVTPRPDGTPCTWLVLKFPFTDVSGKRYLGGMAIDVTEQKTLEAQLRQSQKMEAIGQLAGGVAHDFNNLLTVITGYCDLLLEDLSPHAQAQEKIQEIKKAAEWASLLTRQLLAFGRRQVLASKVLNLNDVVAEMETMLRRLIGEHIELSTVPHPALAKVKADPGQIEQVVLNLAVNARDAMPTGGRLTIETANIDLDESSPDKEREAPSGPYVMLAVSDTGCGMSLEIQRHIFEPFFTTKELGKGTGLGLSTVYGIVKQSGGFISVSSEVGQGTAFKIYLPKVDEDVAAGEKRSGATPQRVGSEIVLLVEDEEPVRAIAQRILNSNGYRVLTARHGDEALQVAGAHQGPIHLLITDMVMPGLNGRQLAERLAPIYPEMRVLYMSGYADIGIVNRGLLEPGTPFLQKPFTPEVLQRKVREVLDAQCSR